MHWLNSPWLKAVCQTAIDEAECEMHGEGEEISQIEGGFHNRRDHSRESTFIIEDVTLRTQVSFNL